MEFDWGYFFSLFSVGAFWQACVTVVVVSSLSWFIGLILGFLLACAKLSGPRWLKVPVELYIWFFRSVPLMVLLVFVYNLPQLFPATQPLLGIPFIAGLVSMTVTEAAYMAEIHRGGLLSVAKGQSEAGHALSFSFIGVQRLIIIPQAFRISLPTLINEYITIIKLSSILSVISLPELLLTGQRLYAQNFLVMETLLAVAVYYVMVVTVFTWLFRGLENLLDIQRKRPQTLNESECATLRQNLKSANADIGAARANFFPSISLTASAGVGSDSLSSLFSHGMQVWSFAPSISLPLFTGGSNLAQLRYAEAEKKGLIATYEKTIQSAFKDVADALARRETLSEQLDAQNKYVAAEQKSLNIALKSYQAGVGDYLSVLTAQRTLWSAQATLISLQQTDLENRITLWQSLGGGAS